MPKYDVQINLSVEIDADSLESAESLVYGELTNRLLDVASRDALFKMWIEIVGLREIYD
jgi:hypothetical protein